MTKRFVCEICQVQFSSEEGFYKHLSEHSRKEVIELQKITEKKLQMTPEEENEFDYEFLKKWLRKPSANKNSN